MAINSSCAVAAVPSRPRRRLAAAISVTAMLSACATGQNAQVAQRPQNAAQSLDDAVASLTTKLLKSAQINSSEQRVLVVDPVIDRATGNQAAVTRAMEPRMLQVVSLGYPRIEPAPFTLASLDRQPIVLVGCTTAVAGPGTALPPSDGRANAYRIWASLADLRTGKFVTREEVAWVRPEDVDMTPTPFFRDSPAWTVSGGMSAHLQACAGDLGDTIDPAYLNSIKAVAAVNDGITAYEGGRYAEALSLYTQASQLPGGDQMRVWNGEYLTNMALGRPREAEEAFGRMVDDGLTQGRLAVKFVFRPASVEFWSDKAVSGQYPAWLRQIAQRSSARNTCLLLIGHTSATGTTAANDALSERRAEFVREQLVQRAPVLRVRTEAQGRGSREPIVGTGQDNATDVLDRRVEFEPHICGGLESDLPPGHT